MHPINSYLPIAANDTETYDSYRQFSINYYAKCLYCGEVNVSYDVANVKKHVTLVKDIKLWTEKHINIELICVDLIAFLDSYCFDATN